MDSRTVTGIVTYSDYFAAYRLYRRRTAIMMNWITLLAAIVGLVVILAGYRSWGIYLMGAGIGGLLGEFIQARFLLPRKVKQLYAQYKGITAPIVYEWDSELFRAQNSMGKSERSWKDFVKIKEDDKVLLLYITDDLFQIVPKSWLKDAWKLEDFRRHATAGREV
jgi:YcxB-like protein